MRIQGHPAKGCPAASDNLCMRNFSPIIRWFLVVSASTFSAGAIAQSGSSATPYFEINSPFIVNLISEKDVVYLQVHAQFLLAQPELKSHLSTHMPAIKHTIMMVLSEQTVENLKSMQGKQLLREKTVQAVRTLLKKQIGEPVVKDILFTSFIIQ